MIQYIVPVFNNRLFSSGGLKNCNFGVNSSVLFFTFMPIRAIKISTKLVIEVLIQKNRKRPSQL